MQKGLIAINNKVSSPQEAQISPLDRGFLFADSIFEVLVAFHGKILCAEEHLQRLRFSAEQVGFTLPWSNEQLLQEMQELCSQTGFAKTYIRLVVTRGEGWGLRAPEPA